MSRPRTVRVVRHARALLGVALLASACGLTQPAPVKPVVRSGTLDQSVLRPGGPGQPYLRYVNPDAHWTEYRKVMLDPVSFWADPHDRRISARDQQAFCDFLYQALRQQLARKFTVVDQIEPATLRVDVAIVDAEAATPVMRSLSMIVPQARVLATLKYLATGSYPFVGSAQVQARVTDAETGMVLGEWVERRRGSGSLKSAAQWQWGDTENAMNRTAADWADRLASWTSGRAKP